MVTTDPIADLLVRIKNAGMAGKETVDIPFSDLKLRIINVLIAEGFLASATKKIKKDGKTDIRLIEVVLKKGRRGEGYIRGTQRVSRPSRRVYKASTELFPFKNGHGVTVITTPKGIMSDAQARKEHVGGEVLCRVW